MQIKYIKEIIFMENTNNEEIKLEDNASSEASEEVVHKYVEFDISMNASVLYDYMIQHAYSGALTLFGTCAGALGILLFLSKGMDNIAYLIFGLALVLFIPVTKFMESRQLMAMNPVYKKPIHYVIDNNGITVSQGDVSTTAKWSQCTKAISTKQSIAVYTGKNNACIFPRKQLGDKLSPLIAALAENMDPKKVKIRF